MPKYAFPDGTPLLLKVLTILLALNIILCFGAGVWADYFAPAAPTATCTAPVSIMRGQGIVYAPAAVALYLKTGLFLNLLGILVGVLLLPWYVRTGRARRTS